MNNSMLYIDLRERLEYSDQWQPWTIPFSFTQLSPQAKLDLRITKARIIHINRLVRPIGCENPENKKEELKNYAILLKKKVKKKKS